MESLTGLISIVLTVLGGLFWFAMKLSKLEGRLDTLEGKKHFERAEQEFTQKLETMLHTAQDKLNHELNPDKIVREIEAARQQAVQQIEAVLDMSNLSGLKTALQELEMAKQRALAEITQVSSLESLLALEQKLNQSLEEFRIKVAEVVNQADARRLAWEHDSEQFLIQIKQQLTEIEAQRGKVASEIAQIKKDALKELQAEISTLKQTIVQPSDPMTALVETLPEITFETAFIDGRQNIRRETRKARQLTEFLPNNVTLEMIYVPGGTFLMGSNEADSEKPIHPVTLQPFFVGKYPVTQAQWQAVMDNNPSNFKGVNRPVETVNWQEAVEYCLKLSQLTGKHYRLLSEAQWEYACRAGSVTKYSFGEIITPVLANYSDSKIGQTTDVGKYPANGFGLYDMHGNVWEWLEDVYHDSYSGAPSDGSAWISGDSNFHLLHGGSWLNNDVGLRCAGRNGYDSTGRNSDRGFRLSRM
ncbi:MAG: SUMF1/EgtB/PvdO family nonheme iron enzyme [Thiotrichaceae bacterium]